MLQCVVDLDVIERNRMHDVDWQRAAYIYIHSPNIHATHSWKEYGSKLDGDKQLNLLC